MGNGIGDAGSGILSRHWITPTARDVLVPSPYVLMFLQLSRLHLNGEEWGGGGVAWGEARRKVETERVIELTP